MTPREYLDAVRERLIADPVIQHFSLRKERWAVQDAFMRARLTLMDGSMLEFGEYIQVTEGGEMEVVTYSKSAVTIASWNQVSVTAEKQPKSRWI